MEVHLSVRVAGNDHGVLELDHALDGELPQLLAHAFRGLLIGVGDGDQVAHPGSFPNDASDGTGF